jgi:hypothetical protein
VEDRTLSLVMDSCLKHPNVTRKFSQARDRIKLTLLYAASS